MKRIRYAALVYARDIPELRPVAEKTIKEEIGMDIELRWM